MSSSPIVAITGAAGALGSTLARRLVGQGYRALLLDVPRASERLTALAAELGADRALGVAGDFSTEADWANALEICAAKLGGAPTFAALVAGGWAGGAALHEATDDGAWTRMMAMNADTVHRALRALLPGMVAARRGGVVVVGARPAERPWTGAGMAAYAASKAAAVSLAQAAAAEVLEHGVRVNVVLPSTIDTPANRASMPGADPGRWVSLDSLAGVIAFLLSDEARDISGALVPVYGRS